MPQNKLTEAIGNIALDKIDPEKEQITTEGKELAEDLTELIEAGTIDPSQWEREFIANVLEFYDEHNKITPGQWKILGNIEDKYL